MRDGDGVCYKPDMGGGGEGRGGGFTSSTRDNTTLLLLFILKRCLQIIIISLNRFITI